MDEAYQLRYLQKSAKKRKEGVCVQYTVYGVFGTSFHLRKMDGDALRSRRSTAKVQCLCDTTCSVRSLIATALLRLGDTQILDGVSRALRACGALVKSASSVLSLVAEILSASRRYADAGWSIAGVTSLLFNF